MINKYLVFPASISPALQIDFVAHDDIPYSSAGSDDVYKHIKEAGADHSAHIIIIITLQNTFRTYLVIVPCFNSFSLLHFSVFCLFIRVTLF